MDVRIYIYICVIVCLSEVASFNDAVPKRKTARFMRFRSRLSQLRRRFFRRSRAHETEITRRGFCPRGRLKKEVRISFAEICLVLKLGWRDCEAFRVTHSSQGLITEEGQKKPFLSSHADRFGIIESRPSQIVD